MGMILGVALFVGMIGGVLISAALAAGAIILTAKASKRRRHAWRVFSLVALGAMPLLAFAVYHWPYDTGAPGSNYDILFRYYFLAGLAYAVVPGAAAFLGFLATLFCRKIQIGRFNRKDHKEHKD